LVSVAPCFFFGGSAGYVVSIPSLFLCRLFHTFSWLTLCRGGLLDPCFCLLRQLCFISFFFLFQAGIPGPPVFLCLYPTGVSFFLILSCAMSTFLLPSFFLTWSATSVPLLLSLDFLRLLFNALLVSSVAAFRLCFSRAPFLSTGPDNHRVMALLCFL